MLGPGGATEGCERRRAAIPRSQWLGGRPLPQETCFSSALDEGIHRCRKVFWLAPHVNVSGERSEKAGRAFARNAPNESPHTGGTGILACPPVSCHLSEDRQECLSYTLRPRLRASNPSTSNPCPAYHRLFHSQGYERINARGAARGQIASQ